MPACRRDKRVQFAGLEAGKAQIEVQTFEITEFEPEQLLVPRAVLIEPVVGEAVSLGLGRGQIIRNMNRHRLEPQPLGGEQPRVANDHDRVAVYHDRLSPTELVNRGGHFVDRSVRDGPWIACVGDRPVDGPMVNSHVGFYGHREITPAEESTTGLGVQANSQVELRCAFPLLGFEGLERSPDPLHPGPRLCVLEAVLSDPSRIQQFAHSDLALDLGDLRSDVVIDRQVTASLGAYVAGVSDWGHRTKPYADRA